MVRLHERPLSSVRLSRGDTRVDLGSTLHSTGSLRISGYLNISAHNLAVDWFGMGLGEKVYFRHQVFGQTSEVFPTLRFNRAAGDCGEFFSPEEPFRYRITFRRTSRQFWLKKNIG